MFESVMKLLSGETAKAGTMSLAQDQTMQAAAALLVHASRIDGTVSASEDARIKELLKARFDLSAADVAELLAAADKSEREAVDLYRFTSVLTRNLDQPGRLRIIEMLWGVVLADGHIDDYESNLVWRVAELIGVSTRDRITLKQRVLAALTPDA